MALLVVRPSDCTFVLLLILPLLRRWQVPLALPIMCPCVSYRIIAAAEDGHQCRSYLRRFDYRNCCRIDWDYYLAGRWIGQCSKGPVMVLQLGQQGVALPAAPRPHCDKIEVQPYPLTPPDQLNVVFSGDLLKRLTPTDRFHGDTGLELAAVDATIVHRMEPL